MAGAVSPIDGVPVAVATRSGWDESVHHGVAVALDARGGVAWTAGDERAAIFPRSALKPLQAAAMLAAGLRVESAQLALVCASHDGCPRHVDVVRSILAAVGLDEGALGNTPSFPINVAAAVDVIRSGGSRSALLHNCSGKHAGMLATARANGWDVEGYLEQSHPLQRCILDHLVAVADGVPHVGLDGCGAPAPVISLVGLARAVRQLAVDGHPTHAAMIAHPELVGGETRDVTRLMRAVPGLMAKDGAEGVMVAALPDGRAVAVKILDGAGRAATVVAAAGLRAVGVAVPSVEPSILGHGQQVGTLRSLVGPS